MGLINNSKKSMYNKVYNKTTIGLTDITKSTSRTSKTKTDTSNSYNNYKNDIGIDESKIITREQAYIEKVKPLLKQINACAQGLEKAENPYWFFWIYRNAEKYSKELLQYEDKLEWKNGTPTEALNELIEKKQVAIKMMIDRYYNLLAKKAKGINIFKINYKEKFYLELNKYKNEFNKDNIEYIEYLYKKFE